MSDVIGRLTPAWDFGLAGRTRLANILRSHQYSSTVAIFVLDLLLNAGTLTPRFYQMNLMDEAGYINNGRLLTAGVLPPYAWNPLGALLYGIFYVPLHAQPSWMLLANWCMRVLLFCLIWLSPWLIARQLPGRPSPVIFLSLLVLTPIVPTLLANSSDGLFAVCSAFAFWQFLSFYHTRRLGHLGLASFFIGLSALVRNDGLPLFVAFLVAVAMLHWLRSSTPHLSKKARRLLFVCLTCTIPFTMLVGGYVFAHGVITGSFSTQTRERSYQAFEQAQGTVSSFSESAWTDGMLAAQQFYGTPEENHNSVLRAIGRNIPAFAQRVARVALQGVIVVLIAYGPLQAAALAFLAVVGIRRLRADGHALFVTSCLLWVAPIGIYLAFFYRAGYVLLPYFVPLALATVGLSALAPRLPRADRWWYTLVGVIGLALVVAGQHHWPETPILVATSVVVALIYSLLTPPAKPVGLGLIVLLAGVISLLLVGLRLPPVHAFQTGSSGEEQSARFMEQHLSPGAVVAAWTPAVVWMAKMRYQEMYLDMYGIKSQQDLDQWIIKNNVQDIYVDSWLRTLAPTAYALIEREIGSRLTVVYTVDSYDPERLVDRADTLPAQASEQFSILAVEPSSLGSTRTGHT